jgi:hypothetical protein
MRHKNMHIICAAVLCDGASQMLEAATAAGKKTEKLQGSLQVESTCGGCIGMCTLTLLQALQAQLDRVISSQPMKRQDTAADAEVLSFD